MDLMDTDYDLDMASDFGKKEEWRDSREEKRKMEEEMKRMAQEMERTGREEEGRE